ncbi:LysR family transcriptional regulator [Streptantibioticus cattleyicolor]|uniref:LysR family transcriptional regulator n=1 Tax=Streptantibioticus cattleyicolor TaxID=29303 RepID=UPI001E5B4D03|nr:LysR family transcriptional regulator [Streptantibioticus cattleyicolor]
MQAVADHGSLHAAQRQGWVTQSSASRRLTRLERRLRTVLVSRGSTGARLTDEGHALLHAGQRLLGAIDFAMANAADTDEPGPRLRVLQMAVSTEYTCEAGEEPAVGFPDVVFDLVPAARQDVWSRFDRYAVDAACGWARSTPALRRYGADVRLVVEEPQWVAVPRGHPLAGRGALGLEDLAEAEWVAIVGESTHEDLARAFARHGLTPRVGCTVHSRSAAADLVARGYGFALVSPLCAAPVEDAGYALRPLRQQVVRRLFLATDPLLLPEALARDLCTGLQRRYVQHAAERNPGYLRSTTFPLPAADLSAPPPGRSAATEPDGPRDPLPFLVCERHWTAEGPSSLVEAEHLYLLRVIERTGSLNRAASDLLITQPALTRRIHRLEQVCGRTLVHSAPRGTCLSPMARRLLHCTEAAEDRLDTLVAALRRAAASTTPPLPRQRPAGSGETSKNRASSLLLSSTEVC